LPGLQKAKIAKLRNDAEAYLNFVKQDRRYDDWYPLRGLKAFSNEEEEEEESHPRTRHQTRERGGSLDCGDLDEAEAMEYEAIHRQVTNIKNIECITLGEHSIRTWYFSPYPGEFFKARHLYICEHCWQYFLAADGLEEHMRKTREWRPLGREIYRKDNLSVFELRGDAQKVPCQSLCLLGKLFIDHKLLFYDVSGFAFYVLCVCDVGGAHIAGFFSREIENEENVLACITIFPPYQRRGYGKLLISMAYEMARRIGRPGRPEHPLSDLGAVAFRSFWWETILEKLVQYSDENLSVSDIVGITGIAEADVIDVLKDHWLVRKVGGEYELVPVNSRSMAGLVESLQLMERKSIFDPRMMIWMQDGELWR
jgi:histone acetyltransferase MYST1